MEKRLSIPHMRAMVFQLRKRNALILEEYLAPAVIVDLAANEDETDLETLIKFLIISIGLIKKEELTCLSENLDHRFHILSNLFISALCEGIEGV
jgi:hypothetical protein